MQLALFESADELALDVPRCTWRGCAESATCALGFGRFKRALLFASYCDAHADDVEGMFRVEARTHAHSFDLAPRYAHAGEALGAESPSVLLGV